MALQLPRPSSYHEYRDKSEKSYRRLSQGHMDSPEGHRGHEGQGHSKVRVRLHSCEQSPTDGQTSPLSKIPVPMKKTPLKSYQHLINPFGSHEDLHHHHDDKRHHHHYHDNHEVSMVIRSRACRELKFKTCGVAVTLCSRLQLNKVLKML